MGLLRRKPIKEHDTSVEVSKQQKATNNAFAEMEKTNRNFAQALERNHVTVKIYSGISGKTKRKKA